MAQGEGTDWYLRRIWGGTWSGWYTMITSDNIASQSVNYANSAGSANAVTWGNVSGKPSLDYQQEYTFTAPPSPDGSGYVWVRMSMGGFNGGGNFVKFSISRAIGWNGANPYGGPSMDVVAYSREWHGGQEGTVITYAEHGSVPGSGFITNAGPRDLAGGGYWFYMRVWAGIDYAMRVYRGSGPIGTAWEETTDPTRVYALRTGVNNIGDVHIGFNTNGNVYGSIFYDYNDTGYYGNFASTSRINAIVYDNLYWAGDQTYGFIGRNVYADTINGRGSDPLELNYYDGGSVIIGTGATGSKALYAGSLFSGGSAVITAANIGSQSVSYATTAGSITSQANSATITAATAATINTIALRDASGDLTVRELVMNVAVQNFTPSSMVAIYPTTNQAVKVDASGARAFLNVPTKTGGDASGTWDISITGSAGGVSWANVSSKPATWLNEPNLIQGSEPDTLRASGFYESYLGSGNPTGTWMNYINVRHSNTANGHGFQLGMSYYDNNLWFRSYSGNVTFLSWSRALGTNTDPYPSNMNQYVRTTDDVTHNSTTSTLFLVNGHSDNTKGYRIHNTSGSSVSAMFTNSSNQLVIAAGAVDQINLNKKVYVNGVALGVNIAPSATAGRIDASNDIVAYSSSDERLKDNITPIENALDKVKSLTGVEFDWKPEHKGAHGHEGHDTGIIAQQVLGVMPSAVRTNDTGYLAVRYEKLIGLLIEANKELAARVEELEKKLG
jgi:hypothetical protein